MTGLKWEGDIVSGAYVRFVNVGRSSSGKTLVWRVEATDDGNEGIGWVRWYGPWRQYSFFPASLTVFEKSCLRDIADFSEQLTKDHREANRGNGP